jgi:hypothetical protein
MPDRAVVVADMAMGERRARLEAWYDRAPRSRFDLSPLVRFRAAVQMISRLDFVREPPRVIRVIEETF